MRIPTTAGAPRARVPWPWVAAVLLLLIASCAFASSYRTAERFFSGDGEGGSKDEELPSIARMRKLVSQHIG